VQFSMFLIYIDCWRIMSITHWCITSTDAWRSLMHSEYASANTLQRKLFFCSSHYVRSWSRTRHRLRRSSSTTTGNFWPRAARTAPCSFSPWATTSATRSASSTFPAKWPRCSGRRQDSWVATQRLSFSCCARQHCDKPLTGVCKFSVLLGSKHAYRDRSIAWTKLWKTSLQSFVGCVCELHVQMPSQSRRHGGTLVGLAPQTNLQALSNWNVKHCKWQEFLSNLWCQATLHKRKVHLLKTFLAMVLCHCSYLHIVPRLHGMRFWKMRFVINCCSSWLEAWTAALGTFWSNETLQECSQTHQCEPVVHNEWRKKWRKKQIAVIWCLRGKIYNEVNLGFLLLNRSPLF